MDSVFQETMSSGKTPGDILSLVCRHGQVTRREVGERLGLAPSTISSYVSELVDAQLLLETASVRAGRGRPSTSLQLGMGTDIFVGMEVCEGGCRIIGVDGSGRMVCPPMTLTGGCRPEDMSRLVTHFKMSCPDRPFGGVGIGVPGSVNREGTRVLLSSRLPHLEEVSAKQLEDLFDLGPCTLANDSNCMALAEFHDAVHKGLIPEESSLLCIYAARGLGAGIVNHGRIIRGANGSAGEISHVRLSRIGDELCSCGGRGCLETIVSGGALIKEVRRAGFVVDTIDDVIALSEAGKVAVEQLMAEQARTFGAAIAMLANFLNPNTVVLSGEIFRVTGYTEAVMEHAFAASHPLIAKRLAVRASCDPMPCVALGAALVARSAIPNL